MDKPNKNWRGPVKSKWDLSMIEAIYADKEKETLVENSTEIAPVVYHNEGVLNIKVENGGKDNKVQKGNKAEDKEI